MEHFGNQNVVFLKSASSGKFVQFHIGEINANGRKDVCGRSLCTLCVVYVVYVDVFNSILLLCGQLNFWFLALDQLLRFVPS
jgi:hypothetical protein